jgi:hypothetical protein
MQSLFQADKEFKIQLRPALPHPPTLVEATFTAIGSM